MRLACGCQKIHVRDPNKPRCTQITTLKTGRAQPWTAGHTPCWVTACGKNGCMLCANINSWAGVHFSSSTSECVYGKNDNLKPLQRGLIGSIQFHIPLCGESPIICQQGTGKLWTQPTKLQQTLTRRYYLKGHTEPLIVSQSDTASWLKKIRT